MLNILYVEDDAASREVLKMIDRMNPGMMTLTIFEDSQDFETRLLGLAPQPNVILLDIHVKPHTGFEMLKLVRSHTQYSKCPVIALTASVMNEEVEELKTAGFDSIFAKPLDIDQFAELLPRVVAGEAIWYIW